MKLVLLGALAFVLSIPGVAQAEDVKEVPNTERVKATDVPQREQPGGRDWAISPPANMQDLSEEEIEAYKRTVPRPDREQPTVTRTRTQLNPQIPPVMPQEGVQPVSPVVENPALQQSMDKTPKQPPAPSDVPQGSSATQ